MARTAGSIKGRAPFAAACGVLSRYVKAATAMEAEARPAPATPVALPLMPGADVSTTRREEREPEPPASCASQPQMTIFYGGRVLVLHEDWAAELLRLAAAGAGAARKDEARPRRQAVGEDLLPVARKASLQRFMEKRRGRVTARATPYSRPDGDDACLKLAL